MNALTIKKRRQRATRAYDLRGPSDDRRRRHTLAVLVDNEPGVLARVIGLFSGRGYNIDSLTVAETDHAGHLSRITIVTSGTPAVIDQIEAQLGRMVPVHDVHDLTVEGPAVAARAGADQGRRAPATSGSRRCASPTSSAPRWSTPRCESFVFEITGAPDKIDAFIDLMRPLGLVEVARTGVAAIARGV